MDVIQSKYEESGISAEDSAELEKSAEQVLTLQAKMRQHLAADIIAVGEQLATANERLSRHGSGNFGRWVEERCGISCSTAYRYRLIYEVWGDCVALTQSADLTAL